MGPALFRANLSHTKLNTENEVTLAGDNYNRWKYSVTIELKKRKLWSIIDGSQEPTASLSTGKKPDEKFEVDKKFENGFICPD
ncbi:hypothetical protein TYRP_022034 [Tyrophagus putrescentiae]|nr:hypothetical protein TYRP_022034 [Tyrophagus putrescentiae]